MNKIIIIQFTFTYVASVLVKIVCKHLIETPRLIPEKVTVAEKNQNLSTAGKRKESSNYAEDSEWLSEAIYSISGGGTDGINVCFLLKSHRII